MIKTEIVKIELDPENYREGLKKIKEDYLQKGYRIKFTTPILDYSLHGSTFTKEIQYVLECEADEK